MLVWFCTGNFFAEIKMMTLDHESEGVHFRHQRPWGHGHWS